MRPGLVRSTAAVVSPSISFGPRRLGRPGHGADSLETSLGGPELPAGALLVPLPPVPLRKPQTRASRFVGRPDIAPAMRGFFKGTSSAGRVTFGQKDPRLSQGGAGS